MFKNKWCRSEKLASKSKQLVKKKMTRINMASVHENTRYQVDKKDKNGQVKNNV